MAWAREAPGLRRRAGALVVDNIFRGMASLGQLHPQARPERHGLAVERDVPYRPTGLRDHLLDVYRPLDASGPLPVVLYVHGGGFRILSKDTHWIMGLAFARRGYVVFNINYRLAPKHPFPAAIDDVRIEEGEDRAIRIEIEMNNSAGIFQVDELLATKLRGSGLEDHVEVTARIEAEHEKRLVPIFRI